MDIKDFILIGGGLLIVVVVSHGFWIAYRAKREPYRLDISPDLIPEDVDDIERLRGELPNGGARVKNRGRSAAPGVETHENLELALEMTPAPILMDVAEEVDPVNHPIRAHARAVEPDISAEIYVEITENGSSPVEARVAEIQLVTPERSQPRTKSTNPYKVRTREVEPKEEVENLPVEELLVINLLAAKGATFDGEALVNALRKQGLKYGEMNIFHRVDPTTKSRIYSVANVVEPGTFDLSDLDAVKSPGISFFLQLPGPEDASASFEDLLSCAQHVAMDLGGELCDEQLSVLTYQNKEHMRQRIADFARKKMFKRA